MAAGQSGELLPWELGGTGVWPMAMDPIALAGGWICSAAWQLGGRLLAVAPRRQLHLWNGTGRQWCEQPLEPPGKIQSLAWNADGSQLAASCNGELALWQPKLGRISGTTWWHAIGSAGLSLAYSDPRRHLAFGLPDRLCLSGRHSAKANPPGSSANFPPRSGTLKYGVIVPAAGGPHCLPAPRLRW